MGELLLPDRDVRMVDGQPYVRGSAYVGHLRELVRQWRGMPPEDVPGPVYRAGLVWAALVERHADQADVMLIALTGQPQPVRGTPVQPSASRSDRVSLWLAALTWILVALVLAWLTWSWHSGPLVSIVLSTWVATSVACGAGLLGLAALARRRAARRTQATRLRTPTR